MTQNPLDEINPLASPELLGLWTDSTDKQTPITIGFWQCCLQQRKVLLDAHCMGMLGFANPTPTTWALDEWKARWHPEEGSDLECRYRLLLERHSVGNALDDVLRVRCEDGEYISISMRGSVMERDENGKALTLAGLFWHKDAKNAVLTTGRDARSDSGRLLFAISSTGDGLWDWDAKNDSVYYSPRYLEMLGYTADEFPGDLETWKEKIHPEDRDKIVVPQARVVESAEHGDTFECTYRIKHKNGSWTWILGRGFVTHRGEDGRATRLVGLHTNISSVQSDREKLEALVKNDALTGLRSRGFCDLEIDRIEAAGLRPVSVITCDIDGLKLVNDYMGHAEGDVLLCKLATILRRPLRATDCVARMGGDEFLMLLPNCTQEGAERIVTSLQNLLAENNTNIAEVPVFASFGAACVEQPDVPLSKALMAADRKMLREKNAHRIASHRLIKSWIEGNKSISVSLEDCRYIS